MKNNNYYVSYWKTGNDIEVFYGSFVQCESFIDAMIEYIATNETYLELCDFTPQANIESEEQYDILMRCPLNMTLDDFDKLELENFDKTSEIEMEELPF